MLHQICLPLLNIQRKVLFLAMTKQQYNAFMSSFYAAYVNVSRKNDLEPIDFRTFKVRMKIWEW